MGRRRWLLLGAVAVVVLAVIQLPGVDIVAERTSIDGGFPSELVAGVVALGALALLPLVPLAFWVLRRGRQGD